MMRHALVLIALPRHIQDAYLKTQARDARRERFSECYDVRGLASAMP